MAEVSAGERLGDYDFELPRERIAQRPLDDRAASRLLALDRASGEVRHLRFRDAPDLLRPGDVLVANQTRVTARRLLGRRAESGGAVELLVLERRPDGTFECLTRPAKRLRRGARIEFDGALRAEVRETRADGRRIVEFDRPEALEKVGAVPLPPYILARLDDPGRYQTVYARPDAALGSAAAPTAGLHFTEALLEQVRAKGVELAYVTLQIGLDTFRPIAVDALDEHAMHGERCALDPTAAAKIAAAERVVAVGTTSVRTLETFARLPGAAGRRLPPGETTSTLFLRPGAEFRVVDAFFTNFHMPRTTMLLMLAAFAGREAVLGAYAAALARDYRFLSFGDAMFLG